MAHSPRSEFVAELEQLEEWQKAQSGELYHAFMCPELVAARDRCTAACDKFNNLSHRTRRNTVALWREITCNPTPLPPPAPTQAEDDAQFTKDPWVMAPTHMDYGFNVHLGPGSMINFNSTFVDTCPIIIGARTMTGPNCSFFSGTHPVDPAIRRGLEGPETGAAIEIGEDCWLGGSVIVLPGIKIGRGSTVGAGSVVTKDVPPFHVVAGNPARILRKIDTPMANEPPRPTDPAVPTPGPGPAPASVPVTKSEFNAEQ